MRERAASLRALVEAARGAHAALNQDAYREVGVTAAGALLPVT